MAVVIRWANEARQTFDKNISYLLEEWTEREIKNFINQTNYIISRIAAHPECIRRHQKAPKYGRRLLINISLYITVLLPKEEGYFINLLA